MPLTGIIYIQGTGEFVIRPRGGSEPSCAQQDAHISAWAYTMADGGPDLVKKV